MLLEDVSPTNMNFGIKGILEHYSLQDTGKDIILPVLLSMMLTPLMVLSPKSNFENLNKLLDFGITVVPILITLILAAYVLLLSMFGNALSEFCSTESGKNLQKKLNSGFAANLIISLVCLIGIFVGNFVTKMEYTSEWASIINIVAYAIFVVMTAYPLFCLFGIIIDLFNLGQITSNK